MLLFWFQLAMSGHDGPWYLEKTNHIPESFHKALGIEPLIVSPRSESNDVMHGDDDNSNSMMSANSDQVLFHSYQVPRKF